MYPVFYWVATFLNMLSGFNLFLGYWLLLRQYLYVLMKGLFFKDWPSLVHVGLCTVISFIVLFLFIRISGKRTLAKLNAFDFVVTVALGSTLAYMMLAMVPVAEGTLVLVLIIMMQYAFAWAAKSSRKMEVLINSSPLLVFYNGRFLTDAMTKGSVTEDEIYAVIRRAGIDYTEDVKAVVMELNGEITVVRKSSGSGLSSLTDVTKGA